MTVSLESLLDKFIIWLPTLAIAIGIIVSFIVLSWILGKLITRSTEKFAVDKNLVSLLKRAIKITMYILGILTALGTLGINVSALVAGLGLTGFALGFALKDTISNLLSGVLILIYRPFRIGDVIKIGTFEGNVVGIDLRYTILNSENEKILIPNSKLFTDPITVQHSDRE